MQPRNPEVLASDDEGRVIVINLPAGESLQEHQVHERAWLVVAAGAVEIDGAGGETISGGPGLLAAFDPNERHEVRATRTPACCSCSRPGPASATRAPAAEPTSHQADTHGHAS